MADNSPDRFDAMPSACNLLLVEDSENDFLLLLHEIRRSGLAAEAQRVATETDLRNALGQTDWDLIICDYNLPGLGGLAAMDIVKQHDRNLPVIMVSGVRGEEFAVETMQAGAGDYVTKDNLSRLVPAIRRELGASEARAARRRADAALQGRNRRLALLSQLAECLLAAAKPADAASAAFGIIADELDLQVYFNFLLEADDRLRLDSCSGIPDRLARLITHLEKGEAVCGVVAETGQPWHFTDIQSSGEKRVRLLRQCGLQAYFCSPLQADNRLLGTLSFGTRSRPRFTDEELDFMRTVVRYVALAGERMRTERRIAAQRAAFSPTGRGLAATGLVGPSRRDGRLLQRAATRVRRFCAEGGRQLAMDAGAASRRSAADAGGLGGGPAHRHSLPDRASGAED